MGKTTEKLHALTREGFLSNIIDQAPIGIITFSSDWKIDYINDSYEKFANLYNLKSNVDIGKNILKTPLFEDSSISSEIKSLANGNYFEKEIKSTEGINNSSISVLLKASPIYDGENFAGGILLFEDSKSFTEAKDSNEINYDFLQTLINSLKGLLIACNSKGEIIYSSGKGINNTELISTIKNQPNIKSLIHLSDNFSRLIENVNSNKTSNCFVFSHNNSFFNADINPIFDRRELLKFVFISITDITQIEKDKLNVKKAEEKLEAEKELLKDEHQNLKNDKELLKQNVEDLNNDIKVLSKEKDELLNYQHLVETIIDAVFTVDLEGKVIFWNKASEDLFGYSKSQIYDKFFGRVLGLFDLEYFKNLTENLKTNNSITKNISIFKKDGKKEIIEAKFKLSSVKQESVIVLCSNVTEWTKELNALKEEEKKYKNIVINSDEIICIIDKLGEITFANNNFCEFLSYNKNEIIGKKIKEIIDYNALGIESFSTSNLNKKSPTIVELILIDNNNKKLKTIFKFHPVLDSNLSLIYFNCFVTNVTENKAIENELLLYNSIFKYSNDGFAVLCNDKFVKANEAFANTFGFINAKELEGLKILDLVDNEDVNKVQNHFELLKNENKLFNKFEILAKKKDGSKFYGETTASIFEINNVEYILVAVRDISEKKRAQEIIKQSEEKYRNLTANIDDFLFTYERIEGNLRPIFFTASVEKITNYSQTDFLSDSKLFLKLIHPDDFKEIKKKLNNLFKSKIQNSGEFEFRIICKLGNIVWVRNKVNIIKDSKGKLLKIFGLVSDISLRKKAEIELKNSSDKLVKLNETKDRFISIISHDLRTPFSSIVGFTDLLLNDKDLSEDEKNQYVKYIQDSSNSMLSLVSSLLDWTRLQTGRIKFQPDRENINNIVNSSINLMSGAAITKNITLTPKIDKNLNVFIDKDLILQVFNNLISNAIKFTNENGEIIISNSKTDRTRFIQFSVKDNGVGIKKENLSKLFNVDTKFTSPGTKGEKGSGLGLSLVKEIIEKHGGEIKVKSTIGEGTEFLFLLPIASENILLVDNNKTDTILYTKILKNIAPDYKIVTAQNGKEAMDIILDSPPALVITENNMPVMNGYNFIKKLKLADIKIKPPVIVLSCDIDKYAINDYTEIGVEHIYKKPIVIREFKVAIEKSLSKSLENI